MLLNFDDDVGARHFEFCFVGFVLGGSMHDKKGMQTLRAEVALFEKLEAISELKPCGKKLVNGEPDRRLRTDDGLKQIQVSPSEVNLLVSYLCATPWQSGSPTKYALDTFDWLTDQLERTRQA